MLLGANRFPLHRGHSQIFGVFLTTFALLYSLTRASNSSIASPTSKIIFNMKNYPSQSIFRFKMNRGVEPASVQLKGLICRGSKIGDVLKDTPSFEISKDLRFPKPKRSFPNRRGKKGHSSTSFRGHKDHITDPYSHNIVLKGLEMSCANLIKELYRINDSLPMTFDSIFKLPSKREKKPDFKNEKNLPSLAFLSLKNTRVQSQLKTKFTKCKPPPLSSFRKNFNELSKIIFGAKRNLPQTSSRAFAHGQMDRKVNSTFPATSPLWFGGRRGKGSSRRIDEEKQEAVLGKEELDKAEGRKLIGSAHPPRRKLSKRGVETPINVPEENFTKGNLFPEMLKLSRKKRQQILKDKSKKETKTIGVDQTLRKRKNEKEKPGKRRGNKIKNLAFNNPKFSSFLNRKEKRLVKLLLFYFYIRKSLEKII